MRIVRSVPIAAEAPLALTIGNFDGVHLGHQAMLSRLRIVADEQHLLACAMTFEPHPREFFAPEQAPARLTTMREKLELLAKYGMDVAHVCHFDEHLARTTAEDFIERFLTRGLGARHVLVGDDFRFGARRTGDIDVLRKHARSCGYTVEAMASITVDGQRVSSTAVREALKNGDLERAARLLGRPYGISGHVVRGDGFGRKLGFPTANVRMKHNRPPLSGIFAVEVSGVGPVSARGVASLGVRPTVKQNGAPVLEVFLFDFSGVLYGRCIRVEFLRKFREEVKFADVEAMTRQIAEDAAQARAYFAARDDDERSGKGKATCGKSEDR
jgi:riboflavin kinase/FMN adenylyltransferase